MTRQDRTGPTQVLPRAGLRAWLGLAVLALPTLLLSMDVTVLYLAVPHIGADLRPSATQVLWISDVYGFMIAGLLVTMGTVGDRIGRRRLLMIGAAAFLVTSVLAAYATSAEALIAARALLGIAGATLMPSTLALISTMFSDPVQRGTAIGIWAACLSGGVALGPIVGGALLEVFWWGSVFLIAVPVMALLLVTAPVLLPEFQSERSGRLDAPSVALSLAAVLAVVYGLKHIAAGGGQLGAAAIALGAVGAVLFWRRQQRLADPLLDVSLFRRRAFTSALMILLVALTCVGGTYMFATLYLQQVAGLSPLVAGLWLLPSAIAMIIGSLLAPALAQRVGAARVMGASLAVAAAGYLALVGLGPADGLPVLVGGITVVYLGMGPIMALGTDLVVGAAPSERAGSASALSETGVELGLALGVAVMGSIGAYVYRREIGGAVPADVPADAAAAARADMSGALAESPRLAAPVADELLEAAREAFTVGVNVIGGVSAAATLVLAVMAVLALRPRPPRTGPAE